jgi:hypothetical protein
VDIRRTPSGKAESGIVDIGNDPGVGYHSRYAVKGLAKNSNKPLGISDYELQPAFSPFNCQRSPSRHACLTLDRTATNHEDTAIELNSFIPEPVMRNGSGVILHARLRQKIRET